MIKTAHQFVNVLTTSYMLGVTEFRKIFGNEDDIAEHLWAKYEANDRRIDMFMQALDSSNLDKLFKWMLRNAYGGFPWILD